MPETTIDDVIERMEVIIQECAEGEGDRKGYFAALYKHVTVAVRDAIRQGGVFEDDARMEQLDVVFATRYLDAYANRDGEVDFPYGPLSRCWKFSFDTAASDQYAIMQHMMLGMSAHILLDLGIAASQVAPTPAALHDMKDDYDKINDILFGVVPLMDCKLDALSPTYRRLSGHFPPALLEAAMVVARELEWSFAHRAVALPDGSEREREVFTRRDEAIVQLDQALILLGGPVYTQMARMEEQMGLSVAEVVTQLAAADDACTASFREAALRPRRAGLGRRQPGFVTV